MGDGNDLSTLLLGLDGFRLLGAIEHDSELVLLVETTAERGWCGRCGVRARSNGRPRTTVRDLPVGGRPSVLMWKKREWRCGEPACPGGTWREHSSQIRPRAVLSERARRWASHRKPWRETSVGRSPGVLPPGPQISIR